jgi:hypothetical protein
MSNPFVLLPFIEEAGALDWRQYTPIDIHSVYGTVTSGAWKTIADLTGEGFINVAAMQTLGGGVNHQLRITVDGVLKYRIGAYNGSYTPALLAVFDRKMLRLINGNMSLHGFGQYGNTVSDLGQSGGLRRSADGFINNSETTDDQALIMRPFPLPFKTSIKVEVRIDNSFVTSTLAAIVKGGIK